MKLQSKNELKNLIHVFLKATLDAHHEPIYLFKNKHYRLRSTCNRNNKTRLLRLVETDINGKNKHTDITTVIDAKIFTAHAKIIGTNNKGDYPNK